MEKSKKKIEKKEMLEINRKAFIDWVYVYHPFKFVNVTKITDDIIKGGEFILTADELLNSFKEIPANLLVNPTKKDIKDNVVIQTEDCVLKYIQDGDTT